MAAPQSGGLFGLGPIEPVASFDGTAAATATLTKDELIRALEVAYAEQPEAPRADRHALRARLELAGAEGVRPNLIIAFEGTGAFEPRIVNAMLAMNRHGPIPMSLSINSRATEVFEAKFGRSGRFSALRRGPLSLLLARPDLLKGGFTWKSFPSEEVELLAGGEEVTGIRNILNAGKDSEESINGTTRGLREAVLATKAALTKASESGVSPRLIVLSHSSGGRTAVKFLEALKKLRDPRTGNRPTRAQLVFTIDPVREAHEALGELTGDGTKGAFQGRFKFGDDPDLKPGEVLLVRRRKQPESLYKPSNSDRWVSLYQNVDTRGLKFDWLPRHGIHGSPIDGADREVSISFDVPADAAAGHGEIGGAAQTLEVFAEEIEKLEELAVAEPVAQAPLTDRQKARRFYERYLITPLGEWRESPFFDDLEEANDFAEALVAGINQDPDSYRSFRELVHAAAKDSSPVLDWFRSSWNKYLRLHRAKYKGGSKAGMTVDDGFLGDGDLEIDGRDRTDWKSSSEWNMKKVSKAIAKADF